MVGTRLHVRQVIAQLGGGLTIDEAARYLDVPSRIVGAAVSYYAEFADEVDADADWASQVEDSEHARWQREQTALT